MQIGGQVHLHAIRNCPKVKDVLIFGNIDGRMVDVVWERCIDWLEMHHLDKLAFESLIIPFGTIWNSRNNSIFRCMDEAAGTVWDKAKQLLEDFRLHNLYNDPMIPKPSRDVNWNKPRGGTIKVNVDAAWANNSDGFVIGGCMKFEDNVVNSKWAELEAVSFGCMWVIDNHASDVILEGDSADIINRFNSKSEDISTMGLYVADIRNSISRINNVRFIWSARSSNRATDRLSEIAQEKL